MRTNILKAAIFTPLSGGRWGLPILAWGEPGIAKTSVIEELCASFSLPCETLSPSERGEGAFGVVPVPEGKGDTMTLINPRPDWTRKFDEKGRGVVFVDEATSTPPALQAPLMGLILARRIGGFTLPAGVRVLAAANPTDLAAGGFDLSAPVANRLGHLDWHAPTADEHAAYMMRGSTGTGGALTDVKEAEEEEERVLREWPNAWARAVGFETAFITRRPEHKNRCPKAGDPKASRGWPSDRSWEAATRAFASAAVNGLTETERDIFVAAFIGEAVASEWFSYIQEQDLPDPSEVLDGKVGFQHNPARLDRTVALLGACTTLVSPPNAQKRNPRATALWQLLENLTERKADLDILVPSVTALIEADLHAIKEASKTLAKVNPVLKAAGITPRRR